ncbi:MAG: hypothetical protein AAFQ98_08755 [Bacteroidota bacterium]
MARPQRKRVLRIFHNHNTYFKDQKSFEDRKEQIAWRSPIPNLSGVFWDGRWKVPEAYLPDQGKSWNILVAHDFNAESLEKAFSQKLWQSPIIEREWSPEKQRYLYTPQLVQTWSLHNAYRAFEIFRLEEAEGVFTLHLQYNPYELGEPHRDNFPLCILRPNETVEIKINGKADHTGSSGSRRVYRELCYRLRLSEAFEEVSFYPPPLSKTPTLALEEPMQTVNLLKRLY